MTLPTTYVAGALLLILSMLCWGSWANTLKLAGRWRFELYCYDLSVGVVVCAAILAFTFGSLNPSELTFQENFLIVSYRKMAYCAGAGMVFNLANMLLLGAMSIAGMAVSFPISLGVAVIVAAIWNFALNPQGNVILVLGGAALVAAAIVVNIFAYITHVDLQAEELKTAALQIDPRAKKSKPKIKPPGPARAVTLSVISGILMGIFSPLMEMGREGDNGVSPYGMALLFAAGVLMSTFLYTPFFLNFPVAGAPLQFTDYFKGAARQHLLGLLGGGLLALGAVAGFVGATTSASVKIGTALGYTAMHAGAVVAALWGLFAWREFQNAKERIGLLLAVMLVLYLAGLGMLSIASLYS
jgi:glucose uptake protein